MNYSVLVIGSIFTCFSAMVLAYISMATMIGPWIAPSVVLMASIVLKLSFRRRTDEQLAQELTLIQTMAQVAGLVAVAIGFTLPTLYFLEPAQFLTLIHNPISFCMLIGGVTLAAGGLGHWFARVFADRLINKEKLPFPVSSLIYNTITSQSKDQQARSMLSGFGLTWLVCALRDGLVIGRWFSLPAFLPVKELVLKLPSFSLIFALSPIYWAIGFTTGMTIVLPLLVGLLSKHLIIDPLNTYAHLLPFQLFSPMKEESFTMAFCSGLVLYELCSEMLSPTKLMKLWKGGSFNPQSWLKQLFGLREYVGHSTTQQTADGSWAWKTFGLVEPVIMVGGCSLFFSYFGFPLLAQLFILFATLVVTYQANVLSGKIGLVPFGRFATFVMLPSILMFKLSALHITLLCVFVCVVIATSSNMLFEYKVGQLCSISARRLYAYQWLGLLVTALVLGVAFWVLFKNLTIGGSELFCQRGKSRALLIQSLNFDLVVLGLGALYGLMLKPFKVSPTMVFGGILMPSSLTIGLVVGALGSYFAEKPQKQYPFWSGVFSAESIWLIASILLKMV